DLKCRCRFLPGAVATSLSAPSIAHHILSLGLKFLVQPEDRREDVDVIIKLPVAGI
ncbi:hypothetical protein XENOCAPTIV_015390, partial [Xenoophorus captivus]